MTDIDKKLKQEVSKDLLETRVGGGGREFTYMSNYGTKTQLNEIFGHLGWDYRVVTLDQICEGKEVAYRARVELTLHPDPSNPSFEKCITKEDVGFGSGKFGSDYDKHELAGKEAVTDALKRCACSLGPALGLHLYDKHNAVHSEMTSAKGKSDSKPTSSKKSSKSASDKLARFKKKNTLPKGVNNKPKKKVAAKAKPKSDRQAELEAEVLSEDQD